MEHGYAVGGYEKTRENILIDRQEELTIFGIISVFL